MRGSRALILAICTVLLITVSVLGTIAWLTSQDAVVNTFSVGKVKITLDEAAVNADGSLAAGGRVKSNAYHLLPGGTYIKDPTLTVKADSETAYVRLLLTINCLEELDAIFAPEGVDLQTIFNGYDESAWIYVATARDTTNNTVTYEFRYKELVTKASDDTVLEPLFQSITIPGTFTSEDMASIEGLVITVEGHAIQATGFDNENEAWAAFDEEMNIGQ